MILMKNVLDLSQNEGNPDAAVFCAYHNAYVLQKNITILLHKGHILRVFKYQLLPIYEVHKYVEKDTYP